MVRLQSKAVSTQPFPPSPFEMAARPSPPRRTRRRRWRRWSAAAARSRARSARRRRGRHGRRRGRTRSARRSGRRCRSRCTSTTAPSSSPSGRSRTTRRRASCARSGGARPSRQGESGCSDLSPGHRFALQEHPAAQLDGAYVVTSVEHRGETHPERRGRVEGLLEHLRVRAGGDDVRAARGRSGRACRWR